MDRFNKFFEFFMKLFVMFIASCFVLYILGAVLSAFFD